MMSAKNKNGGTKPSTVDATGLRLRDERVRRMGMGWNLLEMPGLKREAGSEGFLYDRLVGGAE